MNDDSGRALGLVWSDTPDKSRRKRITAAPLGKNITNGNGTGKNRPKAETAERTMSKENAKTAKPNASPPTEQRRDIAKAVMETLVERLKTEAQRKGGTLSLADIENLDSEFERRTTELETLFEKSFEEYARMFGMPGPEERRGQPFDRLIVEPFEKMFTGPGGTPPEKGGISRRVLPGYFMAVNLMMGPDAASEFRGRAQEIFDRVHPGKRDKLDWRPFLRDSEAQELRTDALVAMAVHFANPDKRAKWFVDLVNNHLAPPSRDPRVEPGWTLSRISYDRIIDALFSDLIAKVSQPKGREALTERYGPEACDSITAIMKGLGA